MTALTHAEAAARARLIEVAGYAIDLDLTAGEAVFGATTVIRFAGRRPGAGTFVELRPVTLRRAVLNGRELDPAALAGARLPLSDLQADNELRIEAEMAYSRASEGMHRFTDPADGEVYLAAHCGVDNAQRVFAAFDQPDLKAPLTVTATAPAGWTVLGNAAVDTRAAGPGGAVRWRFTATPPISTYLFTLAAGRYHSIRAEHRGVPFGLHCRRSLAGHLDREAGEILAVTRACFDRYRELFAEPYPFDSYDQAFVPELAAGAMENPGCVTLRDEFVFQSTVTQAERQTRSMIIAHEMAHMWFGDLVTMRWWDDIWLSESFATYLGFQVLSEATGCTGPWTDFALARKPRGYDADQRPTTHAVAPGPAQVPDVGAALAAYDDISYAKGAAALRQLATWLGRPAFLAGINDYLTRYRFGSATLSDLLESLSRASGRDVGEWAARWLRTAGVDTLIPWPTSLPSPLAAPAPGEVIIEHRGTRPHCLTVGVYDDAPGPPGRLSARASVPVRIGADAGRAVAALPPGPAPALVLLNDGDLSYCKIRFDPRSWATITAALSGVPDPLARAVIWNAVRDLVRDGQLPARECLDLAARHLPAETDTSIAAQVLGFARDQVADRYLDPRHRDAALALIAGTCRELLDRNPAAGDRGGRDGGAPDRAAGLRLTAVRGLIDSASGPAGIAGLREWLGGQPPPGFPGPPGGLAPDLRWRILLRLAVLGAASQAGIDQEHDRDPSTTGRQWAARCGAALPDRAGKQAAWAAMFEAGPDAASELSGYLLTATAQGFWHPEQAGLLTGYVPRYFAAVLQAAARRGGATARLLAQHGFPYYAVDELTLKAGEDGLERETPGPELRRLLADQVDDLRRALRVRSGHGDHLLWGHSYFSRHKE